MTLPTPEEAKRLMEGVAETRRQFIRGAFKSLPPGAASAAERVLQGIVQVDPVPPAPPTVITGPISTGPCPKCRDRGWYFVDILQGTTKSCACKAEF